MHSIEFGLFGIWQLVFCGVEFCLGFWTGGYIGSRSMHDEAFLRKTQVVLSTGVYVSCKSILHSMFLDVFPGLVEVEVEVYTRAPRVVPALLG